MSTHPWLGRSPSQRHFWQVPIRRVVPASVRWIAFIGGHWIALGALPPLDGTREWLQMMRGELRDLAFVIWGEAPPERAIRPEFTEWAGDVFARPIEAYMGRPPGWWRRAHAVDAGDGGA